MNKGLPPNRNRVCVPDFRSQGRLIRHDFVPILGTVVPDLGTIVKCSAESQASVRIIAVI